MRITKWEARDIAKVAKREAGYDITQYAGYYTIWKDDNDRFVDYAVAINKEQDENGNDQHFAIYVSHSYKEADFWEYTDTDDVEELAMKLIEIADNIEKEEQNN